MGIQMAEADAFRFACARPRNRKDTKFERLLELAHMVVTAQNAYERHRKIHFRAH